MYKKLSLKVLSVSISFPLVLLISACSSGALAPTKTESPSTSNNGGILAGESIETAKWLENLEDVKFAVKKVNVDGCNFTANGTGFFVDDIFLTNRHVVEDAKSVEVVMGYGQYASASGWGFNAKFDLAWIKFSNTPTQKLVLASKDVIPGDLVADIGFPLGAPLRIERGRAFDFHQAFEDGLTDGELLRITSEALPGNSGGPVVDTSGKVVGAVVALDFDANLSLAIPASTIQKFLKALPDKVKPSLCN